MSTATVPPPTTPLTVQAILEQVTPVQRSELLQALLAAAAAEGGYTHYRVPGPTGEVVGTFVPTFRSTATKPPVISAELQAELDRRVATLDDVVTADEMYSRLGLVVPRRSSKR